MFIFVLLVLRFVHVIASVCWAGGAIVNVLFIEPTAKALAPTGMQFVQYMVGKRRFNVFMGMTSSLTVLSGALLIWQVSGGQLLAYSRSGPGLGFVLGSIAGVLVYLVGILGIMPRANRLAAIGAQIQGAPTPAQGAELAKLDKEMSTLGLIDFVLVALSLALMATARYWIS